MKNLNISVKWLSDYTIQFEEFFDLTHILREKIKTKKLTCEWESIKLQLDRHLLNKVSYNQICSIFHQFILSLKKSHQLDIFITIFCITDEVYNHVKILASRQFEIGMS